MGKLNIIDAANFIFEGEFEKIRVPENSLLDEQSIIVSLEKYKTEFVDKGNALGELNDGFLTMNHNF